MLIRELSLKNFFEMNVAITFMKRFPKTGVHQKNFKIYLDKILYLD